MTGSKLAVTCGCALATSSLGIRRGPWATFRAMSYADVIRWGATPTVVCWEANARQGGEGSGSGDDAKKGRTMTLFKPGRVLVGLASRSCLSKEAHVI